jgi:hypothetical protein
VDVSEEMKELKKKYPDCRTRGEYCKKEEYKDDEPYEMQMVLMRNSHTGLEELHNVVKHRFWKSEYWKELRQQGWEVVND